MGILFFGIGVLFWGWITLLLQGFKEKRVKILSLMGVVMIIMNLVNEIDVSVNPVEFYSGSGRNSGEMIQLRREIRFVERVQFGELKYWEELLGDYKLQQIGGPTQSQSSILQKLRVKLSNHQQSILHLPNIDKYRMETLFMHYVNDKNIQSPTPNNNNIYRNTVASIIYNHQQPTTAQHTAADSLNTAHEKTSNNNHHQKQYDVERYPQHIPQKQHKASYQLDTSTISPHNHHYILVPDTPSQSLLVFLYQLLTEHKIDCTVIFTSLPAHINVFPIGELIETIEIDPNNKLQKEYLQLISHQLMLNTQNVSGSIVQQQLEVCEKYSEIDYKLYLRIMSDRTKQPLQICYQRTLIQPQPQVQCLIKMMQSPDQYLSYRKARKCFKTNNSIPQSLIVTKQGKIRARKQHYWHNKLTANQIGLAISNNQSTIIQL